MPLKAGDDLGTGVLIGPHDLTPLLRVELAGEHGGVYQIAKQDGELAAFSLWWLWRWRRGYDVGRLIGLMGWRLGSLGWRDRRGQR
jgi:hypothetical protein